jgi:CHAT domain-containing protein/tetratricopeptide (TPR) repeat protein
MERTTRRVCLCWKTLRFFIFKATRRRRRFRFFGACSNSKEQTLGAFHPNTVRTASNLATSLAKINQQAEAADLFERVLRFDQQNSRESADVATTAVQLGVCYRELGRIDKAEELFKEARRIRERLFGPNSTEVKEVTGHLGVLYAQQGDTRRAMELLAQITAPDASHTTENLDTARTLNNMAVAYQKTGDYAKADPLLQHAFTIVERIQGKEHPDTAAALNNLASLKMALGQRKEAESLFERALAIKEKALGPRSPDVADGLTNLAAIYVESGMMGKAKPLLQRALEIYEKAYGGHHERVITCLTNLGETYARSNEPAKAKLLFQRALTACETANGPDHILNGPVLNNLGTLYFTLGDPPSAVPFLRRPLHLYSKAFGDHHPTTVGILENLALAEFRCGHMSEFDALVHRAEEGLRTVLANVLSFASEAERLSWHFQHSPLTLYALKPHPAEFARSVFRYKGIVLDSIVEDHSIFASADKDSQSALETLRTSKQALWQATLATANGAGADERKSLDAAMEQVREAEKVLARRFAAYGQTRRALDVEVGQIQVVLPPGAVLVDTVRYMHFLDSVDGELRYMAIVLPSRGDPCLVPLGKADPLDKLVELFQKSIRGATDEETGRVTIQKLYEQVWMPIERMLPKETERIILSTDAHLCFIPFAALAGVEGKFVCERYRIDYIANARDMLNKARPLNRSTSVIFANPAFAVAASKSDSSDRAVIAASALREMRFPSLPGAEREGRLLADRFKASGLAPQLLSGADATEMRLRSLNSPRILHFATHGFFVSERNKAEAKESIPVNAMQRSGLALTGAQVTLDAWRNGRTPATESDGILTSEEISTLKLDRTCLVTLSACDTGSGEAQFGEGVMGLRRGFVQAGAQSLLMTLWPISDETTVQIMLDFYDAALKSGNAPQAMADTQRDWLMRLRKERGLFSAVQLAGPFIMSSQGKP